jgi:GAF domain-containing protein
LLLEVNNSVVSHLDLRDLFRVIAACLHRVIPHDAARLTLFDTASNQLRIIALDSQVFGDGPAARSALVPIEGTPAGMDLTKRRTILVSWSDLKKSSSPYVQRLVANGVKSGVTAPLILDGRVLGTLDLASLKDSTFTEADAEMITQFAGQISIATREALHVDLIPSRHIRGVGQPSPVRRERPRNFIRFRPEHAERLRLATPGHRQGPDIPFRLRVDLALDDEAPVPRPVGG